MPFSKPELISQAECARRLDCSHTAIKLWLEKKRLKGYPDKDGRILVDWKKAKHFKPRRNAPRLPKAPDETDASSPSDGPEPLDLDLAKAKLKRETFLAHTAELEFKKKAGELVSADDVAKTWDAIATNLRRRILVLPDRLAPLVAAELDPRKVHEMLTAELHQCLNTLDQAPEESPDGSDESSESDEDT